MGRRPISRSRYTNSPVWPMACRTTSPSISQPCPQPIVFPASLGRIVLNILLLAADSLPEGGQIMLAGTPEDLFIRIDGPAAAWPAGMALCLANEAEARSALTDGRHPQMALTVQLAHIADMRLSALLATHTQSEPAILRLGR